MTKQDLTGKKLHAVVQGDKDRKMFYALILNPTHNVMYKMTGKFKKFESLMVHVEKWAKDEGVKELSWDAKLKR